MGKDCLAQKPAKKKKEYYGKVDEMKKNIHHV
jgi:hypothetical protein